MRSRWASTSASAVSNPQKDLFLGHLEAEDADRPLPPCPDVQADIEGEGRLAHRRPRGNDDEVGRLQPGRQVIDVGEARGYAGYETLLRLNPFDGLEAVLDELLHRHEAAVDAVFGDGEDFLLRPVEHGVGVVIGGVGAGDDLVGRMDQIAQRRLFLDDLCVVRDVGRARDAVGQRADVGGAADLLQIARAVQGVPQRDEVDRLAPLAEAGDPVEDTAVGVAVEVVSLDELRPRR